MTGYPLTAIYEDKSVVEALPKYTTMPTASIDYIGITAQYIGETTTSGGAYQYIKNAFYVCLAAEENGASVYYWDNTVVNTPIVKFSCRQNDRAVKAFFSPVGGLGMAKNFLIVETIENVPDFDINAILTVVGINKTKKYRIRDFQQLPLNELGSGQRTFIKLE